jgi:uncharacterized cupin superfamily protein
VSDVNLYEVETEQVEGRPAGYELSRVRVGELIGATSLGLSVYDLAPGQSAFPYHYEIGREEWLLVLSGRPTLRDPDDEYQLEPGDLVVFPEGEEGAHKVTNKGDEVVRFAMLSNTDDPSIAIYPDSGKLGVWPDGKLFRLADEVDYFDGET